MRRPRLFSSRMSRIELDLREEMNRTLFGANDEIAKGRLFILRRMRLQPGLTYPTKPTDLLECSCRTSHHHEADVEYACHICKGEGYLFDDEPVIGYRADRYGYQDIEERMPQSIQHFNTPFIYLDYHENVSRYDKVIEALLNEEGEIVSPTIEKERYNIHYAEPFRSDNGRIEYWRLSCFTD